MSRRQFGVSIGPTLSSAQISAFFGGRSTFHESKYHRRTTAQQSDMHTWILRMNKHFESKAISTAPDPYFDRKRHKGRRSAYRSSFALTSSSQVVATGHPSGALGAIRCRTSKMLVAVKRSVHGPASMRRI